MPTLHEYPPSGLHAHTSPSVHAHPTRGGCTPGYPTRLEIDANPDLLRAHVPPAWLARRELAAVTSVLLGVGSGGCQSDAPPAGKPVPTLAQAVVAPVFVHGDGRGSVGCVVVSPPSFLSEEEALAVIRHELAAHGVDLSATDVEFATIKVPQVPYTWKREGDKNIRVDRPDKTGLVVDGFDPARRIAIEFVSTRDYIDLVRYEAFFTVTNFDLERGATIVAQHVEDADEPIYFGTFYDPVVKPESIVAWQTQQGASKQPVRLEDMLRQVDEHRARCREAAEDLLRNQVRDFADWLKAQGVI